MEKDRHLTKIFEKSLNVVWNVDVDRQVMCRRKI